MSAIVRINERSWGIDLISCINEYLVGKDILIKRAGGENSLKSERNTMFPDVLLFGDSQSSKILQGWELKMPDTSIDDTEFIENAFKKAKLLKLNSFLLWNVNYAKLYIVENDDKIVIKEWQLERLLNTRQDVHHSRADWVGLLHQILDDIVYFLNNGRISTTSVVETLTSDDILHLILNNKQVLVDKYILKIASDVNFEDDINLWWSFVSNEYPKGSSKLDILAEINILSWINKFIFANLIKRDFQQARSITQINTATSPDEAINIIENISRQCDFWNIFKKQIGNEYIPDIIWNDLVTFNTFLIDANIHNIAQSNWQNIFENLISENHRKLYGQYPTPKNLAKLLVNLTIEDRNLNVLDPCCGTGTIAKEVYNLKKQYHIAEDELVESVWASDKVAFPLQLTTISLFNPCDIGKILNVFQMDVAVLNIGEDIEFSNPYTGEEVFKKLPAFDYIVSNLPFVKGQDISEDNSEIFAINDLITELTNDNLILPSRTDLAYYIPFKLWSIMKDNGKLGIILPNSWLGTEAGETFRKILQRFFFIENIITSGNGRWFKNAKIVTTILILKRKNQINLDNGDEQICFTTLKQNLDVLNVDTHISEIRKNITVDNDIVKKVIYSVIQIQELEALGVKWSALFTNLTWLPQISDKLIHASNFFNINRGERRGWDELFYPVLPNNIENEFLKPFLKTASSVDNLIATPDGVAFCCNLDMDTLEADYSGAYSWINSFKNIRNGVGRLLPDVLSGSNIKWYEMSDSATADFVTSINPDERLFIAKFEQPTFVNQRLIRFTKINNEIDLELLHALLNSILGIFYLEILGFGRGESVLDLNARKLQGALQILNPNLLTQKQKEKILQKFQPLLNRNIKPLLEELASQDRIEFDDTVLSAFEIQDYKDKIQQSLLELFRIRKTARD